MDGNLVTLAAVKAYLQITGTATDTLISSYIAMTEAEVEAYVDRPLALGTYTEVLDYLQSKFDRTGHTYLDAWFADPNLFLENYPIVRVLEINQGAVPTSSIVVDPDNGVISDRSTWGGNYTLNSLPFYPTVTYVAGYTTGTVPASLAGVIYQGIASLYNNNPAASSSSGNVKSKRIKDFSVEYGNAETSYIGSSGQGASARFGKTYLEANHIILDRFMNINL